MSSIPFDAEAIRLLAGILVETGLTEIEIAEKDSRIRLVRGGGSPAQAAMMPASAHSAPEMMPTIPPLDEALHPGAVLSPMVGVVFLASEPGAAPFVSLGQTVSTGQTLLLIEAMKTFNQIKATKSGILTRVLVSSGAPVEYGEPLMIVE